jgi:mannose-1-phosphate guanylyltransferase
VLFCERHQFIVTRVCNLAHFGNDAAHVPDGLDNVSGACFALGPDHGRAFTDSSERLAQVARPAHKGNGEIMLPDVMVRVGRSEDFALVYVIHLEGLEDFGFGKVTDTALGHYGNRNRPLDAFDHLGVAHASDSAIPSDIRWDPLEGHDRNCASVLCNLRVLWRNDVHDDAALQHLSKANLEPPSAGAGLLGSRFGCRITVRLHIEANYDSDSVGLHAQSRSDRARSSRFWDCTCPTPGNCVHPPTGTTRYSDGMRGIVIAGGFGTRLRPLTLTRPKPLMPLVNAPLLEYQLSYLRAAGVSEVCFATNYMSDAVQAHFGDGSAIGMSLVYAVEEEPLDTAGAIRNAYDTFPGDPEGYVVFNGDVIHGFDIADIVRGHVAGDRDVTLTLRSVERPHAYGRVPVLSDGRVEGFYEPSQEQKLAAGGERTGEFDTINAGLYVMSAAAIETIPLRKCNVERETFPQLIAGGWKVYGDVRDDYWIDIGRPSQYLEAVSAIVEGKVGSPRNFLKRGDAAVHESADVDEGAKLCCNSSIGPGVVVAAGAEICGSALLEGVVIEEGAQITRSILAEGCRVGPRAEVRQSVLGAGSVVTENGLLGEYA